jgi:hypothetical protein
LGNVVYFNKNKTFKIIDFGATLKYKNDNEKIFIDGTKGFAPSYLDDYFDNVNDDNYSTILQNFIRNDLYALSKILISLSRVVDN